MSDTGLRVLMVAHNYPLSSETYIETERRFISERAQPYVLARHAVRDEITPEHGPFLAGPSRRRLRRFLRDFSPDVVHINWGMVTEWGVGVARRAGVPWTLRTHSFDLLVRPESEVRKVAARADDSDCLGVLALPFAVPILERAGLDPTKMIETRPVADVGRFRSCRPRGDGVLLFGALHERKAVAAASFARLSAMVPSVPFRHYPVGTGSRRHLRHELEEINAREGGRVEFRDWVPHSQMPAVWERHRWFVYPGPPYEGFGWPVGVVEAWAAGVGVCIQRVRPDIEDYVADAAVVFDDIEDIAPLLTEPPDPQMVARGRERAETMDVNVHGPALFDLWRAGGLAV